MNDGILLRGLDGSNPLAFLAALGTLRTLTLALSDETVKMSWDQHDGAWRPRVWCSLSNDGDALIAKINDAVSQAADRASFTIGDNLNLPAGDFRHHLLESLKKLDTAMTPTARIDADFLAAFGSDAIVNDDGSMQDTALRTMSGAGHQHFLKFFRELVAKTDADHLRRALFLKWDYADEGRGMNLRWDPADDRRYALRWDDPSTDPSKTMRGANRLAIETLPLLPTLPTANGLATTAFAGRGARDTFFTWPIWTPPLNADVTRSLLAGVSRLRLDEGDKLNEPARRAIAEQRAALGIASLFTSARITTGKFRNFTPGVAV